MTGGDAEWDWEPFRGKMKCTGTFHVAPPNTLRAMKGKKHLISFITNDKRKELAIMIMTVIMIIR